MQIVEIKKTAANKGIAGFYTTDSDLDPSEWSWNDHGNGPELAEPDNTVGPFATEAKAQAWLNTHCWRAEAMLAGHLDGSFTPFVTLPEAKEEAELYWRGLSEEERRHARVWLDRLDPASGNMAAEQIQVHGFDK